MTETAVTGGSVLPSEIPVPPQPKLQGLLRKKQQASSLSKKSLPLPMGEVARISGSERVRDIQRKSGNTEYLL